MTEEITITGAGTSRANLAVVLIIIIAAMIASFFSAQAVMGSASPPASPAMEGPANVTPGQTLAVSGGTVSGVRTGRVIVSEGRAAFKAPVQAYPGDRININLALVNNGENPLDLRVVLSPPEGFTVDVKGTGAATGVVPVSRNVWAFTLRQGEDAEEDLTLVCRLSSGIPPGNYSIGCVIEPLVWTPR